MEKPSCYFPSRGVVISHPPINKNNEWKKRVVPCQPQRVAMFCSQLANSDAALRSTLRKLKSGIEEQM